MSNPESSSSRQYSPGNQTRDLSRSDQMSDRVSSLSHQLGQAHQPSAVSKPDSIIKVKSSKEYCVKITDDGTTCHISGICETAAGELLIADHNNKKVKLLDPTYKVVTHCDLPGKPLSMCSIDSSRVAVTVLGQVNFIRVTNGQLIKDRTLKLQHNCMGIAHHQGNLYIAAGSALYHYNVDGRLVSKMYDDASNSRLVLDCITVTSCAVSPDGDRIYVANQACNQLVTLSRYGMVISKLTDPAIDWRFASLPIGIHVTGSGQVLVCGGWANTILQVERDGRKRLAEVVTPMDVVTQPTSVYYSKHTGSIVVGVLRDYILVFKAQ